VLVLELPLESMSGHWGVSVSRGVGEHERTLEMMIVGCASGTTVDSDSGWQSEDQRQTSKLPSVRSNTMKPLPYSQFKQTQDYPRITISHSSR
jgi:hypothetical protein